MRRALLAGAVIAASGVLGAGSALADNQEVTVVDDSFTPRHVGVKPGETVTWINPGGAPAGHRHNVRFEDGMFTDPMPARVGPWTTARTFPTAGRYRYHCEIHGGPGGFGMSGSVFVNEAGAAPPAASFVARPNPARVGDVVSFDGSASTASGSSIVRYQWDLDGDGSFETDTAATPTTSRTYSTPASLLVRLRVTGSGGLTDETTRSLGIAAAAQPPPGQPPPNPQPRPRRPGKCSKLRGRRRAACVGRSCGRLRGSKRRACVRKVTRRA